MQQLLAELAALPWELALRLLVAAALGGLVGVEREAKDHPAGLRTNMLVSVGACLFTLISIFGFSSGSNSADISRVAAQIVSGIGFLGAGAVFRDDDRIRGMTTAATIWLVAAVGMAAGAGLFFIATMTTITTIIILVLLRPLGAVLGQSLRHQDAPDDPETG